MYQSIKKTQSEKYFFILEKIDFSKNKSQNFQIFDKNRKCSDFCGKWKFCDFGFWIFFGKYFFENQFSPRWKIFFTLCFFNALVHTSTIQKTYLENSQCLQGGKRFGAGTLWLKNLVFQAKIIIWACLRIWDGGAWVRNLGADFQKMFECKWIDLEAQEIFWPLVFFIS